MAAAVGALGAALGTMVANLSSHKRGWDERWEEFSRVAEDGKAAWSELVRLVDEDTDAFNAIMDAFGLPQASEAERAARAEAIQAATRRAIEAPLRVMEVAARSLDVLEQMAQKGMPASISDAGVGAACVRTAVLGAFLNVRINAKELADRGAADAYVAKGRELLERVLEREQKILAAVEAKIDG